MSDWKSNYDRTRPLSDKELEQIVLEYDSGSDSSGSELENNEEYEPFEDSGSEYEPSSDEDVSDNMCPIPCKRKKIQEKLQTEPETVANISQEAMIEEDDIPADSSSLNPESAQISLRGKMDIDGQLLQGEQQGYR
ncbi:unnamed protein product [Acanthoscelides obtectus]|uniref:Uncharacterized protein n=1 Tax=Acanthoscelides obtectus TaxID=200917 RepID=A0A9P0M4R5_ACAOB|nr:unnamed protein product [Acanthoscelides obtectus]CAK1634071.1 hypothetical protein AOBTE_LOCUS8582 [Acanthoscelides obtectus]